MGDLPLESLLPFMTPRHAEAAEGLFRRGDAAGEMFHLLSGAVRLEELGKTLGPGAMLGEISMFAPRRERTATAVCDSDVELLSITAEKVMQLYCQNPRFGFPVVRLITGRLIENLRRSKPVAARNAARAATRGLRRAGRRMAVESPATVLTAGLPHAPPAPLADAPRRRGRGRDRPARRRLAARGLPALQGEPRRRRNQLDPRRHRAERRQSSRACPTRAPGSGPTGPIVTVRNRHNDPSAAEQAAAEVARAAEIAEELRRYVDALRQLDAEWQARTASHAAPFKQNLEVTLTSARLESSGSGSS